MPRPSLPQSVRASAAASVVACTAGLGGNSQTNSAQAAPVWIDAPHLEGTQQPDSFHDYDFGLADFDQDGQDDFMLFYYFNAWTIYAGIGSEDNGDILYSSATQISTSWSITPEVFASRENVYNAAIAYTPLPRPVGVISAEDMQDQYGSRSFLGSVFKGGDGQTYAGYLELELFDNGDWTQASITIYDAGYALVPEPSSFALLGLGGLLLARRRRG